MKNHLVILAVLSVLSIQANATGNENNSGCIGNCTTNPSKPSNVTSTSSSSGVNNSRANSNANSKAYSNSDSHATGGSIRDSGNSNSKSMANGGSVRDSGNSNSTSTGGSIHDSGNSNSTANGGSVYDSGNSKNTNKNIQDQTQSTNNANNTKNDITVEGDTNKYPDIPASTAVAPSIQSTAMCQVARSGGFQNTIFGISLGGTITDESCVRLEQFRVITSAITDTNTVNSMACLASPLYRQARKDMGQPCMEDIKLQNVKPVAVMGIK